MCENCSVQKKRGELFITAKSFWQVESRLLKQLALLSASISAAYGTAHLFGQGPGLAGAVLLAAGAIRHACVVTVSDKLVKRYAGMSGWVLIALGGLSLLAGYIDVDNRKITTVQTGGTDNLMSGLWGALISSVVAVGIIIVTVMAQRKGIEQQISAQTVEQATNRRVQAAASAMDSLFQINAAVTQSDPAAVSAAHGRSLHGCLVWKIDSGAARVLIEEIMHWCDSVHRGAHTYLTLSKGYEAEGEGTASSSNMCATQRGQLTEVRKRISTVIAFVIGQIDKHFHDPTDPVRQAEYLASQRRHLEDWIFGDFVEVEDTPQTVSAIAVAG